MGKEQGGAPAQPTKPSDTQSRTTIIVAIIGVVGVLGTGILSNWDKLFGPKPDDHAKSAAAGAPPTITPTISPNISPTISPTINVTAAAPAQPNPLSLATCIPMLASLPPELADRALKDPQSLANALVASAQSGNMACVRALLDAGAPPNGPDAALGGASRSPTPLLGAIQANNIEMMTTLINAGADPNLRSLATANSPGLSPIAAASSSSLAAVKLLVAQGANVNSPTREDRSALHRAVSRGDAETVRELLAHGAKIDARDVDGKTPLDIAEASHQELVPLLSTAAK